MNVTTRAANQFHGIDPEHVAAILDHLRTTAIPPATHIVEVETTGRAYRCIVGQHIETGARTLLGVLETQREESS